MFQNNNLQFMQFLCMALKSWSGCCKCAELLGPHMCVCVCVCVCFIERVMNSYCLTPFFREWWGEENWWLLHSSQCCGPYSKLVGSCHRKGIWQIVDNCGLPLHLQIWDTVIIICWRHCNTGLLWTTIEIYCLKRIY